jgi:hypothetical protein
MNKEVIILGKGPSYKAFNQEKLNDTWTTQATYNKLTENEQVKITKVFRFHPFELDLPPNKYGITLDFKFIPINKIRDIFGDQMHSSIAWLVATAVLTDNKIIKMYGVDLLNSLERGVQRDGLFRLMGLCESFGAQFITPVNSGMFLPPSLYGLQDFVKELNNEK